MTWERQKNEEKERMAVWMLERIKEIKRSDERAEVDTRMEKEGE